MCQSIQNALKNLLFPTKSNAPFQDKAKHNCDHDAKQSFERPKNRLFDALYTKVLPDTWSGEQISFLSLSLGDTYLSRSNIDRA